MDLITPSFGIIFWQTVTFACVFLVLKKFAWKPIHSVMKSREATVQKLIESIKNAKEEAEKIKINNEEQIRQVSLKGDAIINEAMDTKNKILADAKLEVEKLNQEMYDKAMKNIENEKFIALNSLKSYFVKTSVKMTEALLKKELAKDENQQKLLEDMLDNIDKDDL